MASSGGDATSRPEGCAIPREGNTVALGSAGAKASAVVDEKLNPLNKMPETANSATSGQLQRLGTERMVRP